MNHSPAAWVVAVFGIVGFFVLANDIRRIFREGGYWGMRSLSYVSRNDTPGKFWLQIYLRIFFAIGCLGLAAFAILSRSA